MPIQCLVDALYLFFVEVAKLACQAGWITGQNGFTLEWTLLFFIFINNGCFIYFYKNNILSINLNLRIKQFEGWIH